MDQSPAIDGVPVVDLLRGDCYRAAFRLLRRWPGAVLVHGFPRLTRGPFSGRRYGHAWIEVGDQLVVEPDHGLVVLRAVYYDTGAIVERYCLRYSAEEAERLASSTGRYGPWVEPDDLDEDPLFWESPEVQAEVQAVAAGQVEAAG